MSISSSLHMLTILARQVTRIRAKSFSPTRPFNRIQSGMVQPVVNEMFATVHAAGSSLLGLFTSCTVYNLRFDTITASQSDESLEHVLLAAANCQLCVSLVRERVVAFVSACAARCLSLAVSLTTHSQFTSRGASRASGPTTPSTY
eukprot:scaffold351_cov117-Isochrysis_galbana.AAC.8